MYTFLFAAGRTGAGLELAPRRALAAVERLFSGIGPELETVEIALPEIGGACAYVQPTAPRREHLLSTAMEGPLFVLAYGSVFDVPAERPAKKVLDAWNAGGLRAVRAIEGSFCAVVADRRTGETHLVSDLAGRRSWFFASTEDGLLVSNHDLALAATQRIPTDVDLETAASILQLGWSLGGRSLLRSVQPCHPLSFVRWDGRRVEQIRDASFPTERIAAADRRGLDEAVDEVIESLQTIARWAHRTQGSTVAELTAGADSRAVLGVLLSCIDAGELSFTTTGAPDDPEVLTARRLAEIHDLRHRVFEIGSFEPDGFVGHARLLAFLTNGETNGKRAVFAAPRLDRPVAPVFSGHAAEAYRGDPYEAGSDIDPRGLSFEAAVDDLKMDFRKRRPSPWRDPEMARRVEARWDSVVETHRAEVQTGTDLLDVIYVYECYRRVAAHGQDNPWTLRVAPFADPKALMTYFRFPSPRGRGALVHRTILRRYLPKSYWRVPINFEELAPFLGPGLVQRIGRRVTRDVLDSLARRRPGKPLEGPDRTTGEMFAGPMRPMLRDLLGRKDGLCTQVLRRDATGLLFDALAEKTSWAIDQIGLLVTMEHWLEQLNALTRFAQDAVRPARSSADFQKR